MRTSALLIGMLGATFGILSALGMLLAGQAASAITAAAAALQALAGPASATARAAQPSLAQAQGQAAHIQGQALFAIACCLIALLGAGLAPRFLGTSAVLLLVAAVGIGGALNWQALVAAPTLLIAAILAGIGALAPEEEPRPVDLLIEIRDLLRTRGRELASDGSSGLLRSFGTAPPRVEPLPEEELLALGKSLAYQLARGERSGASFSPTEEKALAAFRKSPGGDYPRSIPLGLR